MDEKTKTFIDSLVLIQTKDNLFQFFLDTSEYMNSHILHLHDHPRINSLLSAKDDFLFTMASVALRGLPPFQAASNTLPDILYFIDLINEISDSEEGDSINVNIELDFSEEMLDSDE